MQRIRQLIQRCKLCRAIRAALLRRELHKLSERKDRKTAEINDATAQAVEMARRHRHDPVLQAHRLALRIEHNDLHEQWKQVRQKLDNLEGLNGGVPA